MSRFNRELDQFAANVLQEICEHDWIRERCFNEGDNLLKQNQLLEPALGRRAQNLLHIICYPQTHHLRKLQNEQCATKDFIKYILQTLDIWTLRESLLEFKLMIELQKTKDSHCEYFIECLAKTTVDFLIDPEKQPPPPPSTSSTASTISSSGAYSYMKANAMSLMSHDDDSSGLGADASDATQVASIADTLRSPTNSNLEQPQQQTSVYTSPPVTGDSAMDDGTTGMDCGGESTNMEAAASAADSRTDGTLNEDGLMETTALSQDDDFEHQQQQLQQFERELEEQQQMEEEREYLEQQELEMQKYHQNQSAGIWLIAPLITKLQNNCQMRVLETACKSGSSFSTFQAKN